MTYIPENRIKPVLRAYVAQCKMDNRQINKTLGVFIDERRYICQVIRNMEQTNGVAYKFASKLAYAKALLNQFPCQTYSNCVMECHRQLCYDTAGPSRKRTPLSDEAKVRRANQWAEYGKPQRSEIAKATTKIMREYTIQERYDANQ
jgi:hypothetical protein